MAKSGFWLRGAKGKLAGTTLYQSGGRTLQREIVTPKNPQTDNQMRQRIHMAVASKFYQDAQQARFAVAFSGKKSNQSNFNAFTSANLKEFGTLIYPTKEQLNNPAFCAYMPWVCSQGNLQGIEVALADDYIDGVGPEISFGEYSEGEAVFYSSWDEVIAANPSLNLQYGDIITVTAVLNDMRFVDGNIVIGNRAPVWVTRQFIFGADLGDGTLQEYLALNGFSSFSTENNPIAALVNVSEAYGADNLYFGADPEGTNKTAMMCSVTRSRYEGGKTQVCNSRFWLDDEAWKIVTRLGYDSQLAEAIASFKKGAVSAASTPTEVLQGAVAVDPDKAINLLYTKSDGKQGQRTSFPASNINAYGARSEEGCYGFILVDFSNLNDFTDIEVVFAGGTAQVGRGIVPLAEAMNRKRAVINLTAPLSTGATGLPFTIKVQGKNLATGTITFPTA